MVFCLQDCQARQKLNLADLENKYNAVIGVYAVDMENGKKICYKPDTRFSYCSTIKVFTAAELLRQKNTSDLNEIRKVVKPGDIKENHNDPFGDPAF